MPINIKTPDEIEKMRVAGQLASEVLQMIGDHVKAGITTQEINDICHDHIVNIQKAIPAPLNYRGFPRSVCTSINHQVCHGIPGDRVLKDGDTVEFGSASIQYAQVATPKTAGSSKPAATPKTAGSPKVQVNDPLVGS